MELVLANRSDEPNLAAIEVRSLGAFSDKRALEIVLPPHETRIINVPKAFTILGHGRQEWAAGSITVRHLRGPGELMARGMIEDRVMRYSAPVEFTDPAAGKGSELHATGLRLGNVAGQPLIPVVILRNVAETESTVNIRIPYTDVDDVTRTIDVERLRLAPGEVRDVSPEIGAQTSNIVTDRLASAGLEVFTSTAPGMILIATQFVSRNGDHVFRAPMVDPQSKGSAGNYPWKLDNSTSTYVYLKNVTDELQNYTVQVDFDGGNYVLGLQQLVPRATFKLDLRALRDSQKPDGHGTVIPANAKGGQVHWSVIGPNNHAMVGRSEYVSQLHGIASTFACSNCCANSYYSGYVNPNPGVLGYDASLPYYAYQQNSNCYGGILAPYGVNPQSWTTDNSSIAVVNSSGLVSGVSPGQTTAWACWMVYVWHWGGFSCESTSFMILPTRIGKPNPLTNNPTQCWGKRCLYFGRTEYAVNHSEGTHGRLLWWPTNI